MSAKTVGGALEWCLRTDVSTPEIVQEPSAAVQVDNRSKGQVNTVDKILDTHRGELVRALLAAEVTALARPINAALMRSELPCIPL
ncbi:hypothetical protein PHYSODRAFT_475730 [Phytophthora sojae]|uniref:Uncharacterized protein n=1 Tax=Phytophthora sojae (strain P6497) TaxID=1094619 RepID=G4YID9_PHYSP|nr:hypothetical protein PHYSODRAFT_475730 [Phytophthora sojae]EGZ27742.1 hypothetical protein PHYSODRAFT_475730 [Phytophthora sojae]|eukprot:XP_009515017.1 hypothetical protein PHYSODRAFT_475730 [Phytophthora sojae]